MRELTDDKSLEKAGRKRLQIGRARESSRRAKQVKIANKICNVREITASPPADWRFSVAASTCGGAKLRWMGAGTSIPSSIKPSTG
jgi:hypothetical protein